MSLKICDKRQQILDAEGHVLVTGGPGSGKTTIALVKALQRISVGMLAGQAVLFLSFSRAAVARIAEASKTQIPKEKAQQLSIQTFHAFFWQLLRSHGYLLGAPQRLQLLLPHDERALSDGIERNDPAWAAWEISRERLFKEEGKVAFDFFAPNAAALLTRCQRIRNLTASRFPLIIVDEAQDTDPNAWRCVEALATKSQIICLADLEQQIFDFLPGIGPERVMQIQAALNPIHVDLGTENNRSADSEILIFGNDVLKGVVRNGSYKGVSRLTYNPKAATRDKAIRMAVGMIRQSIEKETGTSPESIAVLAASGAGVARISAALNSGTNSIPHKILFDEAEVLLASRYAAFLLEPKHPENRKEDTAQSLELLAQVKRASGNVTALKDAKNFLNWANQIRAGKEPKAELVKTCAALLDSISQHRFSGDPSKDWLYIKKLLRDTKNKQLSSIASDLDYLIAFNRGKRIASSLASIWAVDGQYTHARNALDAALAEDQILSGLDDLRGIHVMNMHKAKGKQFDGVVILREQWVSSFVWRGDNPPHPKSRKVLRVAITRAKAHVLILDPAYPSCPIITPYKL